MSTTLRLKAEIEALCDAAGLDMKSVKEIVIRPASITFIVLAEPDTLREMGASEVETVITFPWSVRDAPSGS